MPIHVCVRPPLGPPKSKKSRHAPASNIHLTLIAALTWWYGFLLNIMTGLLDEHSTLNKLLPLSVQMKPQNVLQYIQPIRKSHCHRVKPGQWQDIHILRQMKQGMNHYLEMAKSAPPGWIWFVEVTDMDVIPLFTADFWTGYLWSGKLKKYELHSKCK